MKPVIQPLTRPSCTRPNVHTRRRAPNSTWTKISIDFKFCKILVFLFKNTRNFMVVARNSDSRLIISDICIDYHFSIRSIAKNQLSITIDWTFDSNSFCIRTSDYQGRSINGVQKSEKPRSCKNLEKLECLYHKNWTDFPCLGGYTWNWGLYTIYTPRPDH